MCTDATTVHARQQAAFIWLAVGIALAIVLVSFILTLKFITNVPSPPNLTTVDWTKPTDVATTEKLAGLYQANMTAWQVKSTTVFDLVVTKTLLAMLTTLVTAIIGYVFAKNATPGLQAVAGIMGASPAFERRIDAKVQRAVEDHTGSIKAEAARVVAQKPIHETGP